jgi:non-specific serine/threonine protein kinase
VALFVERARAIRPDFALTGETAAPVAELCRRLDGLPLALELAAARLRVFPPAELLARLDDRFRLLGGGSRTAPLRQQTLRGALDWSYDLLSAAERRLFARLTVFAGGWTLEAAESVGGGAGVAAGAVLDLLTDLVAKSLVVAAAPGGRARYGVLETVRQYGQDRLRESGEARRVRRRHLAHFARRVAAARPHLGFFLPDAATESWLERLEPELDNLRQALAWSLDPAAPAGDVAAGLRLAAALHWFWLARDGFTEGREWLGRLLHRGQSAPAAARAPALASAGFLACWQGDFAAAPAPLEAALGLFRDVDDQAGVAFALVGLAFAADGRGDHEAARPLLSEGLALAGALHDAWLLGFGQHWLGHVAYAQGDLALARTSFEEAIARCRQMGGNAGGVGHSLLWLGRVARAEGDAGAARDWYAQGLRHWLAARTGVAHHRDVAYVLDDLAGLAAAQGAAARAARLFGAAAAVRAAAGHSLEAGLRAGRARDLAAARAALGEAAFATARAAGEALPLEQAVAEALEEGSGGG